MCVLTVMQDLQSRVIFCITPKHAQTVKPKSSALVKGSLHPSLCLSAHSFLELILHQSLLLELSDNSVNIWDKQNNTKQSFLKLILRCFSETQWIEI